MALGSRFVGEDRHPRIFLDLKTIAPVKDWQLEYDS